MRSILFLVALFMASQAADVSDAIVSLRTINPSITGFSGSVRFLDVGDGITTVTLTVAGVTINPDGNHSKSFSSKNIKIFFSFSLVSFLLGSFFSFVSVFLFRFKK